VPELLDQHLDHRARRGEAFRAVEMIDERRRNPWRDECVHEPRVVAGGHGGDVHAVRDREDGGRRPERLDQSGEVCRVRCDVERPFRGRGSAAARVVARNPVVADEIVDQAAVGLRGGREAERQQHERPLAAHLVVDAGAVGALERRH
jgi:hypothetical protein